MNTRIPKTKHAIERMNQRGVPEKVVDLILQHGRYEPFHGNGDVDSVYMTQDYLRKAKPDISDSDYKLLEHYRSVYLVVSDALITVARRPSPRGTSNRPRLKQAIRRTRKTLSRDQVVAAVREVGHE